MRGVFSRNNRYLVAVGGLALASLVLVGLAYVATERDRIEIRDAHLQMTALREDSLELTEALHDQEVAVAEYILAGRPAALAIYERALRAQDEIHERLAAPNVPVADLDAALATVTAYSDAFRNGFARPAIAAVERGDQALLAGLVDGRATTRGELHDALHPLSAAIAAADADLVARDNVLDATRAVATGLGMLAMLLASLLALLLIRRYGRILELDAVQSGIVNRFTEVTSFAHDDTGVAASNLDALGLLVKPDASVTHVLNRSKDRATPEAVRGDAIAEVLPLNALSCCAGMMRGSMYVTDDASATLAVRCPVYPVESGTLVCLPLRSSEQVGAVHLYWRRPNALPLELRGSVTRIAEHAALAIGNRRMMAVLQGQADTDPRTSLANSRRFDAVLEAALASRTPEETLSILMLDIDRFKEFNDRFGHPAGDEALRAFANVLRSCMRDADVAARYGGEEFAVLLSGVDAHEASVIAERIRARTESTPISLAPGVTERITVSIGMASAPAHGTDRVTLLRVADEALYRAKEAGRNRVEYLGPQPPVGSVTADSAGGGGRPRPRRATVARPEPGPASAARAAG